MKIIIFFLCFLFSSLSVNAVSPFNPDISLAGEVKLSKNSTTGKYLPELGHLEMGFTAGIDAYSDAFFNLAYEAGTVEIEEGYLRIRQLPFDFVGRIGRMRTDFNHLNPIHPHELPIVEHPRYLNDFFGAEGLIKDGIELSYLLPLGFYSEIKTLWLTGETDNSFETGHEITGLKWKNFWELGEASGLEWGLSLLNGQNATTQTQITGTNIRYKQLIGDQNYLIANSEYLWSHQQIETHAQFHYLGLQVGPQWQYGVGRNISQQPDGSSPYDDIFFSAQYKWTEFQYYRFKYFSDASQDNGFLLTLNFLMGPHPVHEF